MYIFDPSFFSNDAWKVAQKKRPIPYWYTKYITGYLQFKGFLFFTFDPVAKYSQLSIKPSVLLNDLVYFFFQKVSIKWPGPSKKKSIVLFYFRAASANFWALLNNLQGAA